MENLRLFSKLLLSVLLLLCMWFSVTAWAETPEETEEVVPILLSDGSTIELTENEVLRKAPTSSDAETEHLLWSFTAKEPQLPLLFENRKGEQLVLFFTLLEEHYGEFHALRVEDGKEEWLYPVWFHSRFTPISPIWIEPWIYFGQGPWLEKMNPDDGKIIERFQAREPILSLEARTDVSIDVTIELTYGDAKDMLLHFQNGRFRPRIAAPGNLLASLDLWKRGQWVMESFRSYLDLHRIQREPLSPDLVLQRRNFSLKEAEQAYRRAYDADSTNPSFALYLALTLYYMTIGDFLIRGN
ncbi:MAG: hypothetical protein GY801_28395 [bacterium]|nr:hypothetical protein [bacterium]